MSVIFIHLSDIHFGQERGALFYVHKDVRERLLDDVAAFAAGIAPKRISGVIVTGDIAYSGTEAEYQQAGEWLDRLTTVIGCERSDVQVVPGNHDIDRGQISSAGAYLLKEVEDEGEAKLNVFLRDENDRELLYKRFHAYSEFSEAYNCPLDKNGGGAGDRLIELAPGRRIRIVGLNTALTCSKNDVEGKLLLGERQRVLPRTSGEELIVLAHHPLKWMADAAEAAQYVRARARVLVTGHEHDPSARVERIFEGADLLTIEAGATVPPWSDEEYTFTFNFVEFGWNEAEDALEVNIHPRCWSNEKTEFEEDTMRLDPGATSVVLASPRFREAPKPIAAEGFALAEASEAPVIVQEASDGTIGMGNIPAEYSDIILRFFRDLTAADRLRLLVEVGAIPDNWDKTLSHGNERILFDRAIRDGKADFMRDRLDELNKKDENGGTNG